MNTIRIRTGLFCAVIASLAATAAVAKNPESKEADRVEHITRQGVHRQQQHANNPPRQAPPRAVPPRHSPPASVPRPPAANPPRGGNHGGQDNYAGNGNHSDNGNHGKDNRGGHDNNKGGSYNHGSRDNDNDNRGGHNNNGGYHAGGRNPHFVPPPRYDNPKGNGHAPRHNYSPGHRYTPRYAYSPAYGRSHNYARSPRYVATLPHGYHRHYWNGSPYYYSSGNWYRPYGSSYVVSTAPYGLFVSSLPYYSSLSFGSTRYYYSGGVYYNYEPVRRGYVVARSPYVGFNDDAEDLYFYPAQGQSEQQQTDDRYDCHRWAVDETQYDPVDADYDSGRRSDYDRAITACMTGRGYTIS